MHCALGDPPFEEKELLRLARNPALWRPALAEALLSRFPLHEAQIAPLLCDTLSGREQQVLQQLRLAGLLQGMREGSFPQELPALCESQDSALARGAFALCRLETRPREALGALQSLLPDWAPLLRTLPLLEASRFASSLKGWQEQLPGASAGSRLQALCRMQILLHGWLLKDPESWRGMKQCARCLPAEREILQRAEARLACCERLVLEKDWIFSLGEGELLGHAPGFLATLRDLRALAPGSDPLLLLGESGSGKELAARACHRLSGNSGPFVPLNCAALPASLAEAELFGSSRGAFTGAVDRPGLVERCAGGSLFLDEVGALPLPLQAKLLRVLDSGEFYRVGETRARHSAFRLLSATCEDDKLKGEEFRADLLQRLAGGTLRLPPLRERCEDLPLLTAAFLHESGLRLQAADLLESHAQSCLRACAWPGNVRQLRFAVRRLAGLSPLQRRQAAEELMTSPRPSATANRLPIRLREARDRAEELCIRQALQDCGEDKPEAARRLGISLPTLYARLRQLRESTGTGRPRTAQAG